MRSAIRRFFRRVLDRPGRIAVKEDLWRALRDVVVRHNDPHMSRVGRPPRGFWPVTRRDLEHYLGELEILMQRQIRVGEPGSSAEGREHARLDAGASAVWEFATAIEPVGLVVENRSAETVEGLRIVVDGRDPVDLDGMLELAGVERGASERARAFALFEFCRRHARHGPAPAPEAAREDASVLDPVLFFHGYGYGMCGFRAVTFAVLCVHAGIPCRVWNIGVHTFPEVHFEGRWHVLDPDAEVWFPTADGELASYEEIRSDPEGLLGRVRMTPWYEGRRAELLRAFARGDGRIVAEGEDLHRRVLRGARTFGVRLLPGARIAWLYGAAPGWRSIGRVFPALAPPPPGARVLLELELERALPSDPSAGSHVVPLDALYPLLDVELELDGEGEEVAVELHRDDRVIRVEPLNGDSPQRVYRLRRALLGSAPPEQVRLVLRSTRGGRPRGRLRAFYQASPFLLPRFSPGPNRIELLAERSASPLDLTLHHEPGPPKVARPVASTPADGAELARSGVESFAWTAAGSTAETSFRVRVRERDAVHAVAPQLDRIVPGTSLAVDDLQRSILRGGRDYSWEVCAVDFAGRSVTGWSDPAHFRLHDD